MEMLRRYLDLLVHAQRNSWAASGIEVIRRRAKVAKVKKLRLLDFQRAFAMNFLRNGGDIFTLQKLLGHADLQVLRRYLAQTEGELREAHRKASPVDVWKL